MNNIDVVYTPWQNLKKTPSMDVGQVGFHNNKAVSYFPSLLLLSVGIYIYIYINSSRRLIFGWFCVVQVRTVRVEKRINEVVNRLNRTKVERKPDLKGTTS